MHHSARTTFVPLGNCAPLPASVLSVTWCLVSQTACRGIKRRLREAAVLILGLHGAGTGWTGVKCNVQVSRVLAGVGHTAHPDPTMVQALVAKCITQTEKLTALLHSSARRELETLMTQMAPSSYRLKQEPQTIRALAQALDTHKARGGAAALEERFQPLYDVYDLLERREVGPLSSDTALLSGASHGAFGRCMTCTVS